MSFDMNGETMEEKKEQISRFSGLYKDTIDDFISSPHVVVGVGAIGGYLVDMLAQVGVKKINMIDFDYVERVNVGTQNFYPSDIGQSKAYIRAHRLRSRYDDIEMLFHVGRFKRSFRKENAYWWMCIDCLDTRLRIIEAANASCYKRLMDTRMSGLLYEVYCIKDDSEEKVLKESIEWAKENPVNEGCTTRSTPHCAAIAASVGVNMGLQSDPPYSVKGVLSYYMQRGAYA